MSFDPYYEWLGIPPDEQPADYYRLLGVRRFEANLNVIETAAERQLLLLKTRQNGPHSELTQQLMNEVSCARICLLDRRRKSDYDAKLQERVDNETLASGPAHEVLSLAWEELPELEQPWSADPLQRVPLPGPRSAHVSKTPRRVPNGGLRQTVHLASIRINLPVVFGGLAAIVISLIALFLLFWGNGVYRTTNDGASQDHSADSSVVAKVERAGQGTARGSLRNTPNSQPPQPPVPVSTRKNPSEYTSGQTGDKIPTTTQDTRAVEGQRSSTPGSVPPDVQEQDGFDKSKSGDYQAQEQSRIIPQSDATRGYGVPDNEGAIQRGSRLDSQDLGTGLERGARKRSPPSRPNAGPRNVEGSDDRLAKSGTASPGLSPVFDRSPTEFDLSAAVAQSGPENILLGEPSSFVDANGEIRLEDYSSPENKPRFSIGGASSAGNLTRWPVFGLASEDDSQPITEASSEDTPDKPPLAHIETGPTGLFIRFGNSASPELIEQFSFCSIIIQNDSGQHCIQLHASERIPPLTLGFDDSKETVTLDGMPAATMLSLERIMLEIVRLDMGGIQAPTASGLRANLNKELTVTLDSQLQCELGIRLSESDGRFDIVVMPRYKVNDRRQQLVPAEIKRDLARAQSQLAKNQKELNEAQGNLRSFPRELSRIGGTTPSSELEAAALRVRLVQLEQMGSSLQSKVRRLSEVGPKLASSVEQMERVLTLVNQMSHRLVLHFRVIARGETGDLLLLQATSHD